MMGVSALITETLACGPKRERALGARCGPPPDAGPVAGVVPSGVQASIPAGCNGCGQEVTA
jgi:hypothetical protein